MCIFKTIVDSIYNMYDRCFTRILTRLTSLYLSLKVIIVARATYSSIYPLSHALYKMC